jgi:hypothetical protein
VNRRAPRQETSEAMRYSRRSRPLSATAWVVACDFLAWALILWGLSMIMGCMSDDAVPDGGTTTGAESSGSGSESESTGEGNTEASSSSSSTDADGSSGEPAASTGDAEPCETYEAYETCADAAPAAWACSERLGCDEPTCAGTACWYGCVVEQELAVQECAANSCVEYEDDCAFACWVGIVACLDAEVCGEDEFGACLSTHNGCQDACAR